MNISGKKIIETRTSTIHWEDEENGIVFSRVKPKTEVQIVDIKEDYEVYKNYFHHTHRKILIDITELRRAGKEERDYAAGEGGIYDYFEAVAFLSYSKFNIASILVQVAMKIYTLRKPTRLFYNKKDAISWLKGIK